MASIRTIPDQDSCKNCVHLRWGSDAGWDHCPVNNVDVNWATKSNQICDEHRRSQANDPRIAKQGG